PSVAHVDYSARIQTVHANTSACSTGLGGQRENGPVPVNTELHGRANHLRAHKVRFAALWAMNLICPWPVTVYCISPSRELRSSCADAAGSRAGRIASRFTIC